MSVWTTPDIKPFPQEMIIFYAGGCRFPYLGFYNVCDDTFGNWKTRDVQKWAYVNEITEEADKAERLQKAVEYVYKLLLEETNFTAGGHLPNKYQQKIFETIRQATKENQ